MATDERQMCYIRNVEFCSRKQAQAIDTAAQTRTTGKASMGKGGPQTQQYIRELTVAVSQR